MRRQRAVERPRALARAVLRRNQVIADQRAQRIESFAGRRADAEVCLRAQFAVLRRRIVALRVEHQVGLAREIEPRQARRCERDHEVGVAEKALRQLDRGALLGVGRLAHAGQVEPLDDEAGEIDSRADGVARGSRQRRGQRVVVSEQRVRERALAGVRKTDERDARRLDEVHQPLGAGEVLLGERCVAVLAPARALREQQPDGERACRARERGQRERLDAVRRLGEEFQRVKRCARCVWIVDPVRAMRREPFGKLLDDAGAAMRHELGALGGKPRDKSVVDSIEVPQGEPADRHIASAERLEACRHIADHLDHGHSARAVGRGAVAGDLEWRSRIAARSRGGGLAGAGHQGFDRRNHGRRRGNPRWKRVSKRVGSVCRPSPINSWLLAAV